MVKLSILIAFFAVASVQAKTTYIYHENTFAVDGCQKLIAKVATLFNATTDKKGFCNVKNQQALGTMTHCIEGMPYKDARQNFLLSCKKYNLTETQYLASFDNATKYITNTSDIPKFSVKKLFYLPVYLSQKKINGAWSSEVGRYHNYNRANYYGVALISYWFFIILVAGLINLAYFVFPGFVKTFKGKAVNTYRRYITLPALFGQSHGHHYLILKYIQVLIPTRFESIMVFVWVLLAIIFASVNFQQNEPNIFWPNNIEGEMARKVGDRSGIMVLYLIPQLILFAGRNNFLIWLSGWQQSRFIMIHKWLARISFLLIVVHGVGLTLNGKTLGKYESRNAQSYMQWGYVATVAAAIMVFQSMMLFRKQNYELFLGVHIIMAVFFVIGGWLHTADDNYQLWFYAASAVWALDRAVRVGRLAVFGVKVANVQLISMETLRVTVPRPAFWKPFPGCIAFIHFLRPTCFWQSHPFTIVDSVTDSNTITFYLKVKGGITHGLYQYLSKQPGNTANIKVSIEGPYGTRSALNRFENIVLLAGGTGIPALYAHALDTVQKGMAKQSIKLYWTVRHYRSVEWFYQELLKLENTNVQVVVYVTQPLLGLIAPIVNHAADLSSEEEEEEQAELAEKKSDTQESGDYVSTLKQRLPFVEFREGRPEMKQLVEEEIGAAQGAIAFMSCAHGSLVDDTRRAVAEGLNKTNHRVDLFEELQGW